MQINNNVMQKQNSQSPNSKTIDEKLFSIASQISTTEEWEKYINNFYPSFCTLLAKLETRSTNSIEKKDIQKPIAVITGGQPGAGKTALISKYKEILKKEYNTDAVINNSDFYRFCVPGSYKLAIDFPESASKITDPVVKMMRKKLIEESIAQNQSIIIENTLGDTLVVDTMQQNKDYEIWLTLMAVAREESLLSDFERYIKMKETCDVARLVSVEAHDKRYYALDKIATQLENNNIRTIVHSRGKTEEEFPVVEYDSSNNLDRRYKNVIDAMATVREKNYKENLSSYDNRLKTIRNKMEHFGMNPEEEEELKKLEQIIQLSIQKESREK